MIESHHEKKVTADFDSDDTVYDSFNSACKPIPSFTHEHSIPGLSKMATISVKKRKEVLRQMPKK
jgi:hypothetical protein